MDKNLYSGVSGPARVDFDGGGLGDILVTKNTIMSDINYTGFSFEYVYETNYIHPPLPYHGISNN